MKFYITSTKGIFIIVAASVFLIGGVFIYNAWQEQFTESSSLTVSRLSFQKMEKEELKNIFQYNIGQYFWRAQQNDNYKIVFSAKNNEG